MKAIVSNRIYLDNPSNIGDIKAKLTYRIQLPNANPNYTYLSIEVIKNYKLLTKGIISIPQGRFDLIPEGTEIIDKRTVVPVEFPDPRFPLREGQQVVYDETDDTCFINALVGWGKTFTALHIARKLGQKTLVVTHTTALRDQWAEEVEVLYGFKPGIVGSGKLELDTPIVVGNIQTLTKHMEKLSKIFGTVILDEAHHCPATTFSSFVDGMYARYRIALSGTMERKDNKHILFGDYFGPIVHKPPQSHTLAPTVRLMNTNMTLDPELPWVQQINKLLYDPDYQLFIANLVAVQISKGHKVLVVAERTEFLQRLHELLDNHAVLITGDTEFEERKRLVSLVENNEASAICGSRQIFTEGISINCLSCVILASPTDNEILLEQLIGRIMRLQEGKKDPVVIDLQFNGPKDKRKNNARLAFYSKKGWEVNRL